MIMKIFILGLVLFVLVHNQTFNLIKHEIFAQLTGPRCLDGSPAAIYIDEGQQADKFLLYFQSGGLCRGDGLNGMLDYCLQRSTTNLGSSNQYPLKKDFNYHPFLSPDPKINPNFNKWTRAFIPYCDGSLHLGFKSSHIEYKSKNLYFRGQNNTRTHFNYLKEKYNLFNASQIVISGTSAGAMATYLWGNYVYQQAVNKNQVFLLPDSGIFLTNFVNPWNNKTMQYYTSGLFQIAFQQTKLPTDQCSSRYANILDCFRAGNLHDLLLPKTLVIQSTYDAWGLEQILGLKCLTHPFPSNILKCTDEQRAYIQNYHNDLQLSIFNFTKQQRHGIWAIGCVQHGFVQDGLSYQNSSYISPYPEGFTLHLAVERFMKGQKISAIDGTVWPQNKGCSGIINSFKFLRRNIQLYQE